MRFIDFFSGAGMFREGMQKAGHTCIGYVEIDKEARKTYATNFHTEGEWTTWDIKDVDYNTIPYADIWCGGFPCTNMSVANAVSRVGLQGEESGLFLDMCYLLEHVDRKPKHLLIENVKGFTTIHKGKDFLQALEMLHLLGYNIKYEISSGLHYKVPQNRIRTYLICTLRDNNMEQEETIVIPKGKKVKVDSHNIKSLRRYIAENDKMELDFGKRGSLQNGIFSVSKEDYKVNCTLTLANLLEKEVEDKYYLTEEQLEKVKRMKGSKVKTLPDGRLWKEGAVPFPDRTDKNARCVTPSDGSLNRSTHIILDEKGYRRLTIRERARLQGLPDTFLFPVSDSRASLQIGNGVMVEVIRQIAEREFTG